MIALLEICQIPNVVEVIDSKFGEIREDSLYSTIQLPSPHQSGLMNPRATFPSVCNISFGGKTILIMDFNTQL